jgi:NAD-dependent DNA ligase
VTHLVLAPTGGENTSKHEEALKKGIPILSEKSLEAMAGVSIPASATPSKAKKEPKAKATPKKGKKRAAEDDDEDDENDEEDEAPTASAAATPAKAASGAGKPLEGKVFVLSGTASRPRKEFEQWITSLGGVVASTVSGKVRTL